MISVIIPTFNRKERVRQAIQSVLDQQRTDIEIIVVDDGSTDGTKETLLSLHLPIQLITQENGGVSKARNTGIHASTGGYIAFLDSDDVWLPGKLDAQVTFLETHQNISFVYTDQYISENGTILKETRFQKQAPSNAMRFPAFVDLVPVHISTVLVRRNVFDTVGYFNESLRIHEDSELWNRISDRYELGFIEQPFSIYSWDDNETHLMQHRGDALFIENSRKYLALYKENKQRPLTQDELDAVAKSETIINSFC